MLFYLWILSVVSDQDCIITKNLITEVILKGLIALSKALLIIGASGHGRVVADIALNSNQWDSISFVDDHHPDITQNLQWPVVGKSTNLEAFLDQYSNIALGIGNNEVRLNLLYKLSSLDFALPALIHPKSTIGVSVTIGQGSVVMANVAINPASKIGQVCIINTGATVDHDCVLEDGVHIAPGAHLAGNVNVGRGTIIGVGAAVKENTKIGESVIVGAGAAVINDIPDNCTVTGVPARKI
jgi:sugar O-acyltransferase (sialic acid O-acetyltransferase NeuD family)